jgi:hypothetical protein
MWGLVSFIASEQNWQLVDEWKVAYGIALG